MGFRSAVSVANAGRFLASGGFNTLVTYLAYLVLLRWFSYRISYTLAFAGGVALAYGLNRYYVFRRPGNRFSPAWIALIYVGQYLLGLAVVWSWVAWLGGPARIAPLVAVVVSLPLTYLLSAAVFRPARADQVMGASSISQDDARRVLRKAVLLVLIGLPWLSLGLNAVGWLRYGFDLPFYDDWRGYVTGQIDSLSPSYLFTALNDTMAPVGFALDALAQRWLNGNSVAYQFLSMIVVLGTLLLLQWKLLRLVLQDRLQAAACFVFTLLMLQPGSYWGRENLAYHQALPLVFLLGSIWVIAFSGWGRLWRLPATLGLGFLAGMTYISGAFGGLAAALGIGAVAIVGLPRGRRGHMLEGALALGAAGAAAAVTQFVIAILPTLGNGQRATAPLALPYQRDFWLFYLGKIGRSLLLPEELPLVSMAVALLACGAGLMIFVLLLRRLRADPDGPWWNIAVVYGALAATLFVYLALVAAGRANLRDPEIRAAADVFALGFTRFHFFWVTLIWPWAIAGVVLLARSWRPASIRTALVGWLLCAGGIGLMLAGGALGHFKQHEMEASFRNETVICLMTQLQQGEGIDCPEFNLPDLTPAYVYASRIGASFVRHFPVLPIDLGVNDPAPWFRLSRDTGEVHTQQLSASPEGGYLSGEDAQVLIQTGRKDEMANCVMLDVRLSIAVTRDDTVQVFFRPQGAARFTEANSRVRQISAADGVKVLNFRIESERGFEDALRVDPVNLAQSLRLPEMEIRCRMSYSTKPFFKLSEPPIKGQIVASARLDSRPSVRNGYHAGADSQVVFRTAKLLQMAQCSVLRVGARIASERASRAQVYFTRRGRAGFAEADSVTLPLRPIPEGQQLTFRLESATGFEDELRLDPVEDEQDVRIDDVSVSCLRRLSTANAGLVPTAVGGN
jgi:putative flippase GtrA